MHQRGGIELAVFEAFGEVLVEALSFGLGLAELVFVRGLAVLLVNGLSFVHTVIYDAHNQDTENKRFIVELDSETIKIWSSENYFQAVPKLFTNEPLDPYLTLNPSLTYHFMRPTTSDRPETLPRLS